MYDECLHSNTAYEERTAERPTSLLRDMTATQEHSLWLSEAEAGHKGRKEHSKAQHRAARVSIITTSTPKNTTQRGSFSPVRRISFLPNQASVHLPEESPVSASSSGCLFYSLISQPLICGAHTICEPPSFLMIFNSKSTQKVV